MKKLPAVGMFVLVFALMSGTAFAQAQYLIDGVNPLDLVLETAPPNDCATVTIELDPGGVINTSLITATCWIDYDESQVLIKNLVVADDDAGGPWDPGFTSVIPDPNGPGSYYVLVGNFSTVPIDQGPIPICEVEFCSQGLGESEIDIHPGLSFSNIVGDTTVWDPYVDYGLISLIQIVPPPPPDSDDDSIPDDVDNCPYDPNPSQTNSDSDSHGDACDNCPLVDNEDQEDSNGNGIGDACDTDDAQIPTLSEWGMIIFITIILGISVAMLLRRKEA